MREVTETQAAKEWSKIEVILSEQEEMLIAQDFAKDYSKDIALWLLEVNGANSVKKAFTAYRKRIIEWKQEREWKQRNLAQYDNFRCTYLAVA